MPQVWRPGPARVSLLPEPITSHARRARPWNIAMASTHDPKRPHCSTYSSKLETSSCAAKSAVGAMRRYTQMRRRSQLLGCRIEKMRPQIVRPQ